jgi:DNA-binding MarR family transcriptional regulator/GNAT superfamily N-acetyltransferase
VSVDAAVADRVARVRAFNRFYTGVIGVLNDGYLRTPWSVTEARVIFELATRGDTDALTLRRDLGLDSGYLSRLLARFDAEGIVRRQRSEQDRRRQLVTLTAAGQRAFARLDRRSSNSIHALLSRHPERAQRRLLSAMGAIRGVLDTEAAPIDVRLRPALAGEYGWVVERHGAIYHVEYGWDQSFETLVAGVVADFLSHHDRRREAAWIAEAAGEPVGCIFCVARDADTAQLRLLLVEPHARGLGVGTTLVNRCVAFARHAGYSRLVLWTNNVLVDARRIYERAGFHLVNEQPHHSFGTDLVGQNWALDLHANGPAPTS